MNIEHKLRVLSEIAVRLNSEHIVWGVGASLLLYFKGIADEFHDIDLMTTAENVDRAKAILSEMGTLQPPNPNAKYHTRHFYEFIIDGVDIDVMEGFVIVKDGREHDCTFSADSVAEHITVNGKDVPLQYVSDWRRYYELMGRTAKVRMIETANGRTREKNNMILRRYDPDRDFEDIRSWVDDERTHAMWCACCFQYPLERQDFDGIINRRVSERGDTPFIAIMDDGTKAGFFCYFLSHETNEGMLNFIVVNPLLRGTGAAGDMLNAALKYAFEETGADAVNLDVFSENVRAMKCYLKAGFTEKNKTENVFTYNAESWGKCNMVFSK